MKRARSKGSAAALVTLLAACTRPGSATSTHTPEAGQAVASLPEGSLGRIEIRRIDGGPRLTLVARDGDPSPAVAVVFVTDLGPALTTALAAVVESRLHGAGVDADLRVDRDAFRVRALVPDAAHAGTFFAAVAAAASRSIAPGSPEVALAVSRLASLRRNPLDAPELAAAAACTGALGIAPGEPLPDLATASGLTALEDARSASLHAGNAAVAAVGPTAFGIEAAKVLERAGGWLPPVQARPQPWPPSDTGGAYTAPRLDHGAGARLTLSVRVADPLAAAAAAERLGAPGSPLVARLGLLPEPWRVTQVAGVARPHGGCVAMVLEAAGHMPSPFEPSALATATAQREVAAELSIGATPAVAARQIVTAADAREAASRAAWWSLAGAEPGAPPRWTAALGLPAERSLRDLASGAASATDASGDARFQAAIERAAASASFAGAERRAGVERGQGELWVLLASPCGVAEEGPADAGLGALSVLAEVETRRRVESVALEPFITADALGILAHAPFRDERETPTELARRVADAAGRALTATVPSPEALADARALLLDGIEESTGTPQGAVFAAFAGAMAPEHPSWLAPTGLWPRIAGAGAEGVRLRAQALAAGPLRIAVLANADAAQVTAAGDAVDRWLAPVAGPRACHMGTPAFPRPGRHEARLPDGAELAQGFIGVPVPGPGSAERDLAELTVAALDGGGRDGLLEAALRDTDAVASARLVGGSRAPSLAVDVRAPEAGLGPALGQVEALLLRLSTTVSDADLGRAAALVERRDQEGRADPRRRLADLWSGQRPGPWAGPARPALGAWRAFLGATLVGPALVVVEARPQ